MLGGLRLGSADSTFRASSLIRGILLVLSEIFSVSSSLSAGLTNWLTKLPLLQQDWSYEGVLGYFFWLGARKEWAAGPLSVPVNLER